MRTIILICVFLANALYSSLAFSQNTVFVNNAPSNEAPKAVRSYSVKEIKADLKNISSVVTLKPEGSVTRIIHRYLYENRSHTEEMIGRAYLYFPMIERLMAEHDAPEELKYLAIIESALKPVAKSRVGARGMWQFMPATAKEYGLVVNNIVDERLDPEKSTVAAIKYLKNANRRFKSWTLSLAAYNSGGGRVNRAVRRAHSKNFWTLKRFLPRETRSYVPAFIAATYVMNHYQEYGLQPVYPHRDMYVKSKIKLNTSITFGELGNLIGVEAATLQALNPSYFTGFVPANTSFYIPESAYSYVQSYFGLESNYSLNTNVGLMKENHIVAHGETLWNIAQRYHCTPESIMEWNGMVSNALTPNTTLVIYKNQQSSTVNVFSLPKKRAGVKLLDRLPTKPIDVKIMQAPMEKAANRISATRMRRVKLKKYTIRKTTSLYDMANWLDVDLKVLLKLNKELVKSNHLSPGTIITVPGN